MRTITVSYAISWIDRNKFGQPFTTDTINKWFFDGQDKHSSKVLMEGLKNDDRVEMVGVSSYVTVDPRTQEIHGKTATWYSVV